MLPIIHLIRHGATEWSLAGRHTGRTDLPLTDSGESEARAVGRRLRETAFAHAFCSPRARARRTCELAQLPVAAVLDDELREWDYGDYEGLRTTEIVARVPGWNVFRDGCPAGESPAEAGARADRVVAKLCGLTGNVAVFSHAHFLRSLAIRWIRLPVIEAQRLHLNTGSISLLGFEHEHRDEPIIQGWNEQPRESRPGGRTIQTAPT